MKMHHFVLSLFCVTLLSFFTVPAESAGCQLVGTKSEFKYCTVDILRGDDLGGWSYADVFFAGSVIKAINKELTTLQKEQGTIPFAHHVYHYGVRVTDNSPVLLIMVGQFIDRPELVAGTLSFKTLVDLIPIKDQLTFGKLLSMAHGMEVNQTGDYMNIQSFVAEDGMQKTIKRIAENLQRILLEQGKL